MTNVDPATVEGFGHEWRAFDQSQLQPDEFYSIFWGYFSIFAFEDLPPNAEGFDVGCGSGRWAAEIVNRVGLLHCIDPSAGALEVARKNLGGHPAVRFHLASADAIPLPDGSQDFGYSLGVLHHVPDTEKAMRDCVSKLKPGAPFLVYLYYRFDNKPVWFRLLWQSADQLRKIISRLPFQLRKRVTDVLAAGVYWPLARLALLLERAGADVSNFPLGAYRRLSFYTMRTDALDRFGTRLEQRFSYKEIEQMMLRCGLTDIVFSDRVPYWVACGRRSRSSGCGLEVQRPSSA